MITRYILRLCKLSIVWVRYDLDEIVLDLPWLAPIRFLKWLNPVRWFRRNKTSRGERLCQALEALGPIYVKCGQLLSTRRDILPHDIADAFAKLQDQVKPFPGEQAKKLIETALSQSIEDVFLEFELSPLASASIAQVHRARFKESHTETGQSDRVVMKVLRPHILNTLEEDFAILYTLARVLQRFKRFKLFNPMGVVKEIEETVKGELDLLREASNASVLRRLVKEDARLFIPKIYWPYCTSSVMVMEEVFGVPLSHLEKIKSSATPESLKYLAETLVALFYEQVFVYNFFHADMHPGNIFIDFEDPQKPRICLVDFGIMGSLSSEDKNYLAANFMAFFKRDYRKVAELHLESGWVPKNTRVVQFEDALRAVCEPLFERRMRDASGAQTLLRLFQVARKFDMEVMPQLLLLQKTLLNVEGIGRALYPDLDLWAVARPILESWMKKQMGPKALWSEFVGRVAERFKEGVSPCLDWLMRFFRK